MLRLLDTPIRFCDGISRREWLRIGGLSALGLSLPSLGRAKPPEPDRKWFGRAKSCILLWMGGGPPQHETWDPKPDAPAEIRGEFKPIATSVPGINVCELMPRVSKLVDKIAILRALSTDNMIHSPSGYWMLTGFPHPQASIEVAGMFSANDKPSLGSIVSNIRSSTGGLPASITLPEPIVNNPGVGWPGQNAGFLGRKFDPWLVRCDPSAARFSIDELALPSDVSPLQLDNRRSLLQQVERHLADVSRSSSFARHDLAYHRAFDLLHTPQARKAFDLTKEPPSVRDRYGRHKFGQSCLLARRLIEAGVGLVQVNWPREPGDLQAGNPVWDTHSKNAERLKTALAPPMDVGYSALLEDLDQRGMLDETLVVWMGEFGRSPQHNAVGGREHWGYVFSVALAGGGIAGGRVFGASDKHGGFPRDGKVQPQDLAATILSALGIAPDAEVRDPFNRPLAVSCGSTLRQLFG